MMSYQKALAKAKRAEKDMLQTISATDQLTSKSAYKLGVVTVLSTVYDIPVAQVYNDYNNL